ncbi:MAG: GNAT family N-acetyltransferase [Candidatus Bipolaricaulota bacterium]
MKLDLFVQIDTQSSAILQEMFSALRPPQLHLGAIFQGDAAGTAYVDSRERPRAACVLAGDACYLAGMPAEAGFFDGVNALLPRDRYTALFADASISAEGLARAAHGLYMLPAQRRAALLRHPPAEEIPAPDGVDLLPIDRSLLESDAPGADAVRDEVVDEWQTVDAFLDRGFGTVAMSVGSMVGHSIVNYIVRGACEVSVRVVAEYRRRGVGVAVAAATAREAFAQGLREIIWHSWANNVGSIAISRRLGFADESLYTVLVNHWAAENVTDMTHGEFAAFGQEYERRFAECSPSTSGYPYVVAATAFALARDRQACLRNLHQAIDSGWLRSRTQLKALWPELFEDPALPERVPEWAALFARLAP